MYIRNAKMLHQAFLDNLRTTRISNISIQKGVVLTSCDVSKKLQCAETLVVAQLKLISPNHTCQSSLLTGTLIQPIDIVATKYKAEPYLSGNLIVLVSGTCL